MTEPFLSASWYRVASLRPRLVQNADIQRHRYWGKSWYVVREPTSGRTHRFTPSAYSFISALDGQSSVDQIWTRLVTELENSAPTQDEVIRLLQQLFEADLIDSDRMPHAGEFERLIGRRRLAGMRQTAGNPLVLTLPLWDPDRFLDRTLSYVRPVIGPAGFVLWCSLLLPALVLACLYQQELTQNIVDRVLSGQGILLMALTYPVVKAAHEFGHAYAVKALGGEVHRMGVMLIGFFPVPYVDASAASAISSKYKRAFVGAAGMMVELALAAMALYVWLLAEPGIVRAVLFNVMLIAGVSTLLVNGNPLLRFDGYYILSDFAEIPNLAPRASRYWSRLTQRLFTGEPEPAGSVDTDREKTWFLIYGPAAFLYRTAVLIALCIFISAEYFIVGVLVAGLALGGGIVWPLVHGMKRVTGAARTQPARRRALLLLGGGIAGFAIVSLGVPLPLHTNAEGVLWLPEEAYVRARADGFVVKVLAQPGDVVDVGRPIVESTDPFLDTEIRTRRHRVRELEASFNAAQFVDRVQADIVRKELEEEQARLASDMERQERLNARSGFAGVFIAAKTEDMPGRFFKKGDVFGHVVPEKGNIVRAIVAQDDIELVRHRLKSVHILPLDNPFASLRAHVVREVPAANDELPSKALVATGGGAAPADPKDPKGLKTLRRMFQLDLRLDQDIKQPAFGARALIRFEHTWEPVAFQAYRRLRQLFLSRFDA